MAKIWVVAGFLALIGLAQANSGVFGGDTPSVNKMMSETNPYLINR